jgi:hypothetical protein
MSEEQVLEHEVVPPAEDLAEGREGSSIPVGSSIPRLEFAALEHYLLGPK